MHISKFVKRSAISVAALSILGVGSIAGAAEAGTASSAPTAQWLLSMAGVSSAAAATQQACSCELTRTFREGRDCRYTYSCSNASQGQMWASCSTEAATQTVESTVCG